MLNRDLELKYQRFLGSLVKEPFLVNTNTIGEVSPDKGFYFKETSQAISAAKSFLAKFWAYGDHLNITKKFLDKTVETINENASSNYQLTPPCMTIVTIKIGVKEYCLISLSSKGENKNSEFHGCIKDFIRTLNDVREEDGVEHILLTGSAGLLSELIANYNNKEIDVKPCTEKYYVDALLKLFLRFGSAMKITGAVNCVLYPYDGQFTNKDPRFISYDPENKEFQYMPITDEINVLTRQCCRLCKGNKKSIMDFLNHAQKLGDKQKKASDASGLIDLGSLSVLFPKGNSIQQIDPYKKFTQNNSSTEYERSVSLNPLTLSNNKTEVSYPSDALILNPKEEIKNDVENTAMESASDSFIEVKTKKPKMNKKEKKDIRIDKPPQRNEATPSQRLPKDVSNQWSNFFKKSVDIVIKGAVISSAFAVAIKNMKG